MNSVTFQVSLNWHLITGLSTLDQCPETPWHRMQDFWHPKPASLWNIPHPSLDPQLWGTECSPMQEGSLKSLHLKTWPQGSQWIRSVTLLPYLTIVDTTKKPGTDPRHHTISQHPKTGKAWAYTPVEIHLKYPISSVNMPLLWMSSLWFQLGTCVF